MKLKTVEQLSETLTQLQAELYLLNILCVYKTFHTLIHTSYICM